MKIIGASYEILTPINGEEILKFLELAGRTSYKSEDRITPDSARKFISAIIKSGHESVIEHVIVSVRIICDRGCCYDDQTKVLTENGWKYFKDVSANDIFYSLDDNENIVKIKGIKKIEILYNGQMHHYKSTQIDLMVTPNHNMWVFDFDKRSNKTRTWKFIESNQMNNKRYVFNKSAKSKLNIIQPKKIKIPEIFIPRGFYNKKYPELEFESNAFWELIGWWVTDGSINYPKNGSGKRCIISQKKEFGRQRIKELLKSLNIDFYEEDDGYRINCPQLLRWLADNFLRSGDTRKSYYCKIPRWMFNLSSLDIENLLKGIIGGNGTKHTGGKGYQIYTGSKDFAEDLVELCLNIGLAANIYIVPPKKRLFPGRKNTTMCREQYVVSIVTTTKPMFDKRVACRNEIQYSGYVYCVELPQYHRLYVMRNGKPVWCGNSHELVRHRIASYTQESSRYCNYSKAKFGKEITVIKPLDWEEDSLSYLMWKDACENCERSYFILLEEGVTPQLARNVLPHSLKTELFMTMNLREWRHFFKVRTPSDVHPQMREITIPMLREFQERIPVIFDDILIKE